ncbi:hypothetical protein CP061683_0780B, partial [Chlamydia psittaci 06-1683]
FYINCKESVKIEDIELMMSPSK